MFRPHDDDPGNVIALDLRRPPRVSLSLLAVRREIAAHAALARCMLPVGVFSAVLLRARDEADAAALLGVDEDMVRVRLMTLTPEEHMVLEAPFRLRGAAT